MKEFLKILVLYRYRSGWWQHNAVSKMIKQLWGRAASLWYGNPSADFFVIGVTGTNGKTTTVNVLHTLANAHVGKAFSVSTAMVRIGDESEHNATKMSSLDPSSLQKIFRRAKNAGCQVAIIEVTSHGLDQNRFAGIDFDMAILTNITPDHLEYHGSREAYVAAKKKLFTKAVAHRKGKSYAVFPKDDQVGRRRYEEFLFDEKMTFGLTSQAGLMAPTIYEHKDHTNATITYLQESYDLTTYLRGAYNISNILAAMSALVLIGIDIAPMIETITDIESVDGRMQEYEHEGVTYYIDYAHTQDALLKTLKYLDGIKDAGRLRVLSGAMGDGRDRAKRPIMGGLLDRYADMVVLADEDPGSENRFSIIGDIVDGMPTKTLGIDLFVLPQRRDALRFLVDNAQSGDIVFLAGKGHERVMLTQFGREKWNEQEILMEMFDKEV